jgi:protein-tyrosine-phosphatase
MSGEKRITFVCTGNTCRSVMAELLFRDYARKQGKIPYRSSSAGTHALPHYAIIGDLKKVMDLKGLDYSGHVPRPVDDAVMRDSDIVAVMDSSHMSFLTENYPDFSKKLSYLSDLAGKGVCPVPDPYGMGYDSYLDTFDVINGYITALADRIMKGGIS